MLGGTLVYIDGSPLEEALIERLTVSQALGEHWWCEAQFRQTMDRKPPAEEVLGKPLRVVTQDEGGAEVVVFAGFILEVERTFEIWGSSSARLKGVTLSHLLDLTPRRAYFLRESPQDVAAKIMGDAGLEWTAQLDGGPLSYLQHGETDFSFLLRLADDDEKWIRPTWTGLEARDSFADGVTVQWRAERGLLGLAVAGRTEPRAFSGWHYDYRKMESLAVERATSDAATLGSAGQMFQAANRVAQQTPAAFYTSRARLMAVAGLAPQLQKESRRSLSNTVVCRGTSLDQRLKAGDKVTIQGPFDASGDYGLISVLHVWTSTGYENRFVCTPASKFTHARAPQHPILYGVYRARVADNNDPEGLGRLQIQFFWQEENRSCWARVMSPYAGADYGMFLLPEIGDEVWIMFEEGDPERLRVIGSVWNGVHKPPREELWGGDVDPNHVKRIVTKSGHRITLNDKPGQNSIVVATPNHVKLQMIEGSNETGDSMLALHSDGDIVLCAPNGRVHFHARDFSREVGSGGAESGERREKGSGGSGGASSPRPRRKRNGPFATQDEAARAALRVANPRSIRNNKEYAGLIYKGSDSQYYFSGPIRGTDQGANPHRAPAPAAATVVGDYHTHADYSIANPRTGAAVRTSDPARDDFNSDNFSTQDKVGIASDATGVPGYKGYLGTPSGRFRCYDPATGSDTTL